jgi:MerR family mercuric resistance operon transcriptional regulator
MRKDIFTIGQLAAAAKVNVETVRFYQRQRLLSLPTRPLGSIRRYGTEDVARLRFIRRAKAIGFTLEDIAGLLAVEGEEGCAQTRRLIDSKLASVQHRMNELQLLERELLELQGMCGARSDEPGCPTLGRLRQ